MTSLPCPSVLARRENVWRAGWQLRRQPARPRLRLTSQRGKPRHMILVRFTQTPPEGGFGRQLRRRGCVGKGAALQDGFDHSPLTSLRSMGAVPFAVCKPVAARWATGGQIRLRCGFQTFAPHATGKGDPVSILYVSSEAVSSIVDPPCSTAITSSHSVSSREIAAPAIIVPVNV